MSGYDVDESFTQQKEPEITTASDERRLEAELANIFNEFTVKPDTAFIVETHPKVTQFIRSQLSNPKEGKFKGETKQIGQFYYYKLKWKNGNIGIHRLTKEQHEKSLQKYSKLGSSYSYYKQPEDGDIAFTPEQYHQLIQKGYKLASKNGNANEANIRLSIKVQDTGEYHDIWCLAMVKDKQDNATSAVNTANSSSNPS